MATLFNDMTAENRVFLTIDCASHRLLWEKQRGLVHEATHLWLLGGNLRGVTCGTVWADVGGRIRRTGGCEAVDP